MTHIFFDIDGTLCESKQKASNEMLRELFMLYRDYNICLVSGAPYLRMKYQVPLEAVYFAQNGNEIFYEDVLENVNVFHDKEEALKHITLLSKKTGIEVNGETLEDRGSQLSFSLVGHNEPLEIKKAYDPDRKKRTALLEKYPFPRALIGGTSCIDYVPRTKGENIGSFISVNDIKPCECLYIGDALQGYGNDATVCGVIPTFEVKGPEDTLKFIKTL